MEDTMLPEFHNIFTTKHYVPFKIFGNKLLFLSREKSYFKVEQALFQKGIGTGIQSGSKFISKLGSYFKVGQKFFKVGQLFQSGQLFQNGT